MNLSLSNSAIPPHPSADFIEIPLNEVQLNTEPSVIVENTNNPLPSRNIKKCGPQDWHLTISFSAISTIALGILGIELGYHYNVPYLREISYVLILGSIVVLSANNLFLRNQVNFAEKKSNS